MELYGQREKTVSIDTSFLHTKKLVFSGHLPLPMSIYEGMGEAVYLIGNIAAFSTLYSPGIYRVLKAIIAHVSKTPLIIDDLLGMTPDVPGSTHVVWTRKFMSNLISLNRITWECPHVEAKPAFSGHDMVAFVQPAAYLYGKRLDIGSGEVIDNHRDKWFLLPAGDMVRYKHIVQYFADTLKRSVYAITIPAAVVDSCWCLIAPAEVKLEKFPFPMYVSRAQKQVARGFKPDLEKRLFEGTIG